MNFWQERIDLAASFRWVERFNFHEGVANHFSLAVNDSGSKFLMNPNQSHFGRIKASDLIEIDANNPETLAGPNAHVHSIHATVLATLKDSRLPRLIKIVQLFSIAM